MIISLNRLPEKYINAAKIFCEEFSITTAENGVPLILGEAEKLTANYDGKTLTISCKDGAGFFRALSLAAEMPDGKPFAICEEYGVKRLGLMADCSRDAALSIAAIKQLIRYMAALGYNTLQLYFEDMFEVEGEPFFGYLRGRYSRDDLRDLDDYAAMFGIELIPCVQTLAHFTAPSRWGEFTSGKWDLDDILLVGEEKTYIFIEKIFAEMRKCFRSKNINIGMDEAHRLGLGKYLELHGYQNRFDILCKHLKRVSEIAKKYDFEPMMWSDMFFRLNNNGAYFKKGSSVPAEVRAKVPTNVKLAYWDYYSKETDRYDDMFRQHKEFSNPTVFAGGFWKWIGFTPHNGFSIAATEAALCSVKRNKIEEAFFTMWGDNGGECPVFAVLPSIVAAAEISYGHANDETWLEKRFEALSGMRFEDFMLLDLPDILEGDKRDLKDPSKYLLYNDNFMGIFDCTADEEDGKLYAEYARRLKKFENHPKWGYLFASAATLCRALAIKANLGNKTHEAYLDGDKEKLTAIAEHDYGVLLRELRKFHKLFRRQWLTENKPQGLEVHDVRLGGVIGRTEKCRETLREYLAGQTDKIPELEEKRLAFGNAENFHCNQVTHNNWSQMFTGGVS
mgnify:FL=1